jgi:hypothetical protein
MRTIIITSLLIVLLALVGISAAAKSGVDYCKNNPRACLNRELAWPDFLDNSVKPVNGVLA